LGVFINVVYLKDMNIRLFVFLVAMLGALTWLFGSGVESVQEENTQEDVLGNTLDAARDAANSMSR
jgi:hypothetical protein